jgi:hypothetical protein
MERIKMKLTTKQLKQIIKEELRLLTENTGIPELDGLLAEDDIESIIQGLELAEAFGAPIDYQSLLTNKSEKTLKALARSRAGSEMPELLHHIAKVATMFTTLVSIALNPMALPKTLVMMGDYEGVNMANVVARVAKNPSTPMETLIKLSKHKSWFVRSGIAQRDDIPEAILKDLLGDRQAVVRRYARETMNRKIA